MCCVPHKDRHTVLDTMASKPVIARPVARNDVASSLNTPFFTTRCDFTLAAVCGKSRTAQAPGASEELRNIRGKTYVAKEKTKNGKNMGFERHASSPKPFEWAAKRTLFVPENTNRIENHAAVGDLAAIQSRQDGHGRCSRRIYCRRTPSTVDEPTHQERDKLPRIDATLHCLHRN